MKKLSKLFTSLVISLMFSSLFAANWKVKVPANAKRFPLIKIVSTENGGKNDFATVPVTRHVSEAKMSWGDMSDKDTPGPWYEKCTIYLNDEFLGDAEVKARGNWTTTYPKKSLRIKFAKKQNIAGLHSGEQYKNWVLLAAYKDPSLLRDAVGFKMYSKMFPGYVSDCQLVELEINGVYFGVYLLAELQEAKRLGLTNAKKDSADTNIGYLIEFDSYSNTEADNEKFWINYLGDVKDYNGKRVDELQGGYTIKSEIKDKAQHDFIADYMNKLWKICYSAVYNKKYYHFDSNYQLQSYTPEGSNDDEKCRNCISQVINIESLADTYIFNEIVCDPDLYLTSFFMNVDFGEGKDHLLYFNAPWDFDSSMGNKDFCAAKSSSGNITGKNDMFAGSCQTDVNCQHPRIHANPWMVIFIREAWFQNLVKERWAAIPAQQILTELQEYIDENSSKDYQPVFNANLKVWGVSTKHPGVEKELCSASKAAAAKSQAASAEYFKGWLTNRFTAVDNIIKNLK